MLTEKHRRLKSTHKELRRAAPVEPTRVICAVCKRAILPQQRPSVELLDKQEIHVECWDAYIVAQHRKLN